MEVKDHLIFGGISAAALYPAFGNEAAYFFLGSVAIDIDHYLDYLYHSGLASLSPRDMFRYHRLLRGFWRRPGFLNIEVFHTIEFIAPLYIVSSLLGSTALLSLVLGLMFHVALDSVFLLRNRIFTLRANSFTEYFIRRHLFKRRGLRPEDIYIEAVSIMKGEEQAG